MPNPNCIYCGKEVTMYMGSPYCGNKDCSYYKMATDIPSTWKMETTEVKD